MISYFQSVYLCFSFCHAPFQQISIMRLLCANHCMRFEANKIQMMQTAFQILVFNLQISLNWIYINVMNGYNFCSYYFTRTEIKRINRFNKYIYFPPSSCQNLNSVIICCQCCLQSLTESPLAIAYSSCTLMSPWQAQ